MIAKLFLGSVVGLGLLLSSVLGAGEKAKECCSAKAACCNPASACCTNRCQSWLLPDRYEMLCRKAGLLLGSSAAHRPDGYGPLPDCGDLRSLREDDGLLH